MVRLGLLRSTVSLQLQLIAAMAVPLVADHTYAYDEYEVPVRMFVATDVKISDNRVPV